jgi:hypothetical protein
MGDTSLPTNDPRALSPLSICLRRGSAGRAVTLGATYEHERDSGIVSILVAEGSQGDILVIVVIRKLGDNLQADDVLVCLD